MALQQEAHVLLSSDNERRAPFLIVKVLFELFHFLSHNLLIFIGRHFLTFGRHHQALRYVTVKINCRRLDLCLALIDRY